jgi:plasmid maintenance system antidote protein VapI
MIKIKTPPSLGECLDKELKAYNKTEFAKRIGISRAQLYNLINDKRSLTLEVAKSLGEATGKGAKYWLDLEHEHRLYENGLL